MPPRQKHKKRIFRPIGDPSLPDGFGVWVARYLDYRRERNYSERTLENNHSALSAFVSWCEERSLVKPSELTRPILERYQRHLFYVTKSNGRPLSFRSQHVMLVSVRGFFKWLVRQNALLSNPASDLDLPRLPQRLPRDVLTAEEAEQVLAQPNTETLVGLRDRAILETLYSTGMRRSEVLSLLSSDVDAERGTVMIREGKGKRDRMVPIGQRALWWIERYLNEARPSLVLAPDDGTLFLSTLGEKLVPDGFTQKVHAYVKAAGIGKGGACHLFRHTMATLMLEGGADVRHIQEMLGHTSLESTQVYTQVSIRKLKAIHEATHPTGKLRPLAKTTKTDPKQRQGTTE